MTSSILPFSSKCRIDNCEKPVKFKGESLCQMHYFRRMRTGHFGTSISPPGKKKTPHNAGYVTLRIPNHPLAHHSGKVYEHRKVMHDIYGDCLPPCQMCGKASKWDSRGTHIDHIDCNRANNDASNLRVLCNGCNVSRNRKPEKEYANRVVLTVGDLTMTAEEWGRHEGVEIEGFCIRQRKRKGMSDFNAIYSPKRTYNKRQIAEL